MTAPTEPDKWAAPNADGLAVIAATSEPNLSRPASGSFRRIATFNQTIRPTRPANLIHADQIQTNRIRANGNFAMKMRRRNVRVVASRWTWCFARTDPLGEKYSTAPTIPLGSKVNDFRLQDGGLGSKVPDLGLQKFRTVSSARIRELRRRIGSLLPSSHLPPHVSALLSSEYSQFRWHSKTELATSPISAVESTPVRAACWLTIRIPPQRSVSAQRTNYPTVPLRYSWDSLLFVRRW